MVVEGGDAPGGWVETGEERAEVGRCLAVVEEGRGECLEEVEVAQAVRGLMAGEMVGRLEEGDWVAMEVGRVVMEHQEVEGVEESWVVEVEEG